MSPVPAPQWPMTSTPVRSPVACSASQPGELTRLHDLARQFEATLGDDLLVGQALQQPVPQHPELQAVEQLVGRLPVPRLAQQIGHGEGQVEVADQGVDLAVAEHVFGAGLERLGRLALQLAGVHDQVLEPVVGLQPLRRGLGPDAGHAGQVVAGLPDQRGQLGIARGRREVALLDQLRCHPGQVGDAAAGIEHGDVVGDQLEGVPVAGADHDLEALLLGLRWPGWR